jgi:hypothetical protein
MLLKFIMLLISTERTFIKLVFEKLEMPQHSVGWGRSSVTK